MPFDPEKMKAIRKRKGLELAYLGHGLSYFAARSAEMGIRPDPRISTVEKIAKGLGVPIEELLSDVVKKKRKPKAKAAVVTEGVTDAE